MLPHVRSSESAYKWRFDFTNMLAKLIEHTKPDHERTASLLNWAGSQRSQEASRRLLTHDDVLHALCHLRAPRLKHQSLRVSNRLPRASKSVASSRSPKSQERDMSPRVSRIPSSQLSNYILSGNNIQKMTYEVQRHFFLNTLASRHRLCATSHDPVLGPNHQAN